MTQHPTTSRRLDGTPIGSPDKASAAELPQPAAKRGKGPRTGATGQAKALPMDQVPGILAWLECLGDEKESAQVVFALSFYQGLRAREIAGLTVRDVTDHFGRVADVIQIPAKISKYNKAREIPTHPCTAELITIFRRKHPNAEHFAINAKGQPRKANNLAVWFFRLYGQMGLEGCSSHTGRRSLITHLAKNHGQLEMTLRDVQRIAGHARIGTTEAYIEPSPNLHRLVHSVPWASRPVELSSPPPATTKAPPLQMPSIEGPFRMPYSWETTVELEKADGGRS